MAVWYRFAIGASPLLTTLAAVGASRALGTRELLAAYVVLASLPGIGFAYAYNILGLYTSALREFPRALAPAPTTLNYETTKPYLDSYMRIAEYFRENPPGYVVVAEPSLARYVHLAIRNPDPSRFVWTWYRRPEDVACDLLVGRAADAVILVVGADEGSLSLGCRVDVVRADESVPWVYVLTRSETPAAAGSG